MTNGQSVLVVLQQKNHWQSPQAGHVHRLMRDAGLRGAVAKDGHRHTVLFHDLYRQCHACSRWDACANNSIAADHPDGRIAEEHVATPTFAVSGFTAHDFCHDAAGVHAFADIDVMPAMCGADIVICAQRHAGGNAHGFLPVTSMQGAASLSLFGHHAQNLFQTSRQDHPSVDFPLFFYRWRVLHHDAPLRHFDITCIAIRSRAR